MSRRAARRGLQAICVLLVILGTMSGANAGLYWQSGVRTKTVSVCFVGDAVTSRPDRVAQVLRYIKDFSYAANVKFPESGVTCAAPTKLANGNDSYDGDIRVALPFTSAQWFGAVPGVGCTMFRDANGNYDGGNDGWGSWSNSPNDLATNRSCVHNLKLGDDGAGGVPYTNHTLHEFGHALGLSHEHVRNDVDKVWVSFYFQTMKNLDAAEADSLYGAGYRNLDDVANATVAQLQAIPGFGNAADAQRLKMDATFVTQIAGVTLADAIAIYAAGFKTARAVADASVAALQAIPGYGALADATQLKANADAVPPRIIYGDGATGAHITIYDRASVMHYKFNDAGINGNYDYTGLSPLDQLAVHVLYPEDIPVAEFVGTTVVPSTGSIMLRSAWGARGAELGFAVKSFEWRVDGVVRSTTSQLNVQLPLGNHTLQLDYVDFLNRSYTYSGPIHVLTPTTWLQQAASVASQLPLL
jgi:hypothetical protein